MSEASQEDLYLVWSHEHRRWWGPGGRGYVTRIPLAGRYTRDQALRICADAAPGNTDALGALPELPVREADLQEVINRYPYATGLEAVL